MRALIAAGVLLALPAISWARAAEEILAEAQAAFRQGVEHKDRLVQARRDFAKSADAYQELHRIGIRNAALYRNLGNSSALADRWPEAIWAYHMALRFDPNDRAVREYLAIARGKVLYPASGQGRPDAESWPIWLHRPTSNELSWVIACAYVIACLAGTCAVVTRRIGSILLATVSISVALTSGVWLAYQSDLANFDRQEPFVVVSDNVPYYRGNGTSYPQHAAVPVLPRGLETRVIHQRGAWLQVRLTTGEVGWLPRNQVLIVEP